MIKVDKLSVILEGRTVLDSISFEVQDGEKVVILGASGTGKSVLLKTMLGLIQPTQGEIYIDGVNIHKANKEEMHILLSKIGFLFQNSALFDFMTVEENIAFPLVIEGVNEEEISKRVDNALKVVGLSGDNKKMVNQLSGGMQKRVALARAIVKKPKYLFYDEPTSGLDPVRAKAINLLIAQLNRDHGITSITVTHDVNQLMEIADKILFLENSKLVFYDYSDKIDENESLKNFISGGSNAKI